MITDFYNILIGNVKKTKTKTGKNIWRIRIRSITMVKTTCRTQHTKKIIAAEKNDDKNGKMLHKLMRNAVYGIAMENLEIAMA